MSAPSVFRRGLKVIGSYIAMHPGPFFIAMTGATVFALATVGSTIVLGWVTDKTIIPAFNHGVGWGTVLGGAAAILSVGLIKASGVVTRRYFAGMARCRVEATLRLQVVERYQVLPLAYHRARPTGELLAHAQSDIDAAVDVLNPVPYSLAVIMLVVFSTIALVLSDPFLAVIGCSILPGLAILNRIYTNKVEGPAQRGQERVGDVSAVAHESFDGALVVKTLGREEAEVERLRQKAAALRHERVAAGSLRASFELLFDVLPSLGMVALLAVGAWRISGGHITTGKLVQFVSLFQLLAFPMRLIGFVLSDIPRAVVGRQRLQDVFDEKTTMAPAAENLGVPAGPLGISVRHVTFAYRTSYGETSEAGTAVLDDISFEVDPQESVALVGPTGAGKSTITHLLVRLADPDLGSVRVGGVDVRHLDADQLRQAAAVVFQESFLFASSVRDNISLGAEVPDSEVRRAARLAQAHDFIMGLPEGYETVLGERGVTLSGGQRQRVALARALLRRPRLLILDDATSSVDPTIEALILDGLRRELDTTLVVVAYRTSTISLADRVLFLEGGRIVASGTHLELLQRHPAYEAMVRAYERGAA